MAWFGNFKSFDEALNNHSVYVGASGVIHFDQTGNPLSGPVPEVPVPLRLAEGYQEALREPMMPLPPQVPEPKSVALLLLGTVIFFRKSAVQRAGDGATDDGPDGFWEEDIEEVNARGMEDLTGRIETSLQSKSVGPPMDVENEAPKSVQRSARTGMSVSQPLTRPCRS